MKHAIMYIIILFLLSYIESSRNDYKFFPNLPVGEFRSYIKAIIFCDSIRDDDIQLNFYLNKKSRNVTELRGNITLKVPIDDSLSVEINAAVKDSIGGWKDNAFLYKSPKLCSSLKQITGNAWPRFMNNTGIMKTSCPIHPGIYVLKGLDLTDIVSEFNFPKMYFYGSYKVRVSGKDKYDKYILCLIFIIDFKRPWELE